MFNRKREKHYKQLEVEDETHHKIKAMAFNLNINIRMVATEIIECVLCDEELKKRVINKLQGNEK